MRRIHACSAVGMMTALVASVLAQAPSPAPPLPAIAPNLARLDQVITGIGGPGLAIAVSEDGGLLAAGRDDGSIPWWHKDVSMGVRVGSESPQLLRGHQGPVLSLSWRAGPVLASAGADQKIILWAMPEGKPLQTIGAGPVRTLALSPDGKVLASAGDDPGVQLWDTSSGKPLAKLSGHTDWVLALAFSGDGKLLASGGHDGIVRLWEVPGGRKVLDIPTRPAPAANATPTVPATVLALAFAPDSKQLALGIDDGSIQLVNAADGKAIRALAGHTSAVTSLEFHPSGTVLASGSKDRTVRLWNPAAGQLTKALEGHTAWVEGVVFLARGTRLASVSADQSIRLWDLTDPAKK